MGSQTGSRASPEAFLAASPYCRHLKPFYSNTLCPSYGFGLKSEKGGRFPLILGPHRPITGLETPNPPRRDAMHIRNENTHPSKEAARTKPHEIDLTKSNREGIQDTVDRSRQADSVDLSKAAHAAEGHVGPEGSSETGEERALRLDALRAEVEAGTLNSPERVQKAAEKLLGD